MKKFIKYTLIISSLIPLFSCASSNKLKIEKIKDIDSFIYLNKTDLETTFSLKKDFILVIGEVGCSSCEIIRPKLIDYIKDNQIVIYYADYNNYISYAKENDLDTNVYSATILMYQKGEFKTSLEYSSSLYFDDNRLSLSLSSKITSSYYYVINDLDSISYDGTKMYQFNYQTTSKLDNIKSSSSINYFINYSKTDTLLYSYLEDVKKDIYLYYNNDIQISTLNIIDNNNISSINITSKDDLVSNIK
jgi:hypothetical protein